MVFVRAEQGVKARGWDPNGFWGVGVRWGVGWLKTTKGGVSLTAEPVWPSATGPCTANT